MRVQHTYDRTRHENGPYYGDLPESMVTDNRIFSRKFAVYGRLRGDTARKRAVFRRNSGYLNTALYTTSYLCHIRSYASRILTANGRKTPTWITVKYGA
jgi:hypothetical protein